MRRWHEEKRDELKRDVPPLLDRAAQAGEFWVGRVPGLSAGEAGLELHNYRGFYALMYRHHSNVAHASAHGLVFVAEDMPDGGTRVFMEDETEPNPLRLSTALVTYTLYIAVEVLDWPEFIDVRSCWGD